MNQSSYNVSLIVFQRSTLKNIAHFFFDKKLLYVNTGYEKLFEANKSPNNMDKLERDLNIASMFRLLWCLLHTKRSY